MTDPDIIELYFSRSEDAVSETRRMYGALMRSISEGILPDRRDAEEAVSDACLAVWNSIPPERPKSLKAYVSKLTRNASIDKARHNLRKKRGGGELETVLDEASELAGFTRQPDEEAESREFSAILERFLNELPKKSRVVFVQRYWYLLPVKRIASEQGMTAAAVSMTLSRTRKELKELLSREGFYYE